MQKIRNDIDFLKAVAILCVVFYHLFDLLGCQKLIQNVNDKNQHEKQNHDFIDTVQNDGKRDHNCHCRCECCAVDMLEKLVRSALCRAFAL